jgi:hypothetical protein
MRHLCITGGIVRLTRFIYLGLLLALLAGCSPKLTQQPTTTTVPTAARMPPTATAMPANQDVEMGFTAEGWPYRGNPNAAVTLWEFSDFQ